MKLLSIKNRAEHAIVDDEDFERLSKFSWVISGSIPRITRSYIEWTTCNTPNGIFKFKKFKRVSIQNEVMQIFDKIFDHKNLNWLDNQKVNLRQATYSQNAMNKVKVHGCSSNYKGVSWSKMNNKWEARITIKRKTTRLGFFTSEVEAARAYNSKVREFHGEFGVLNKIGEEGEEENGNGTTE